MEARKSYRVMSQFKERVAQLTLTRYPHIDNRLQAWSAADEYLVNTLLDSTIKAGGRVLILNDDTGVLSVVLSEFDCYSVHDSITAKIALEQNCEKNRRDINTIHFYASTDGEKLQELPPFEHILVRIPKSVAYFKDQLNSLRSLFTHNSTVYSSGMVKHISKSITKTLEGYIGPTTAGPIIRKALLCSSRVTQTKTTPLQIKSFQTELGEFSSYSNTFSNGKIDKGTEVLLENIPADISGKVVDLGCGFGPISRKIAACNNSIDLIAVDISYMAVASTRLNVSSATVIIGDGLHHFDDSSLDWVVSNPPFHQNTIFSVNEGLRLFRQVQKKLKSGGMFLMVANSGLNYAPYLQKLFTSVRKLQQKNGYTVFLCRNK